MVRLGSPVEVVSVHPDEVDAARTLFKWARPGDMLLLSTLSQRQPVLDLVSKLRSEGWRPGMALPLDGALQNMRGLAD
jgi:hypothetical protein